MEAHTDKLPPNKYDEILSNSIITINPFALSKAKTKWDTFKTKVTNAKDIVKFTIVFNMNTSANKSNDRTINIFHHKYDIINQKKEYEAKISSIIYCSYRKNFDPIKNYKKADTYLTSDCGWGCMIRSSQMILARGLERMFYSIDKDKYKEFLDEYLKKDFHIKARVKSMLYLMELPVSQCDFCIKLKKLFFKGEDAMAKINNNAIKVIPPFSIKTICSVGELYDKSAGEWFSDVSLPQIYNKINSSFDIIPNLVIMHFHSTIEHETIIKRSFEETIPVNNGNNGIDLTEDELVKSKVNCNETIQFDNKHYHFKKAGLIFVSVRLGLNTIPSEYHNSIKRFFNCKHCIGIIGGKGSSAYYFIGYSPDCFLYFDPHLAQESTKDLGSDTYEAKSLFQLNFSKMQTGFTIGFQFRTLAEYKELIDFFKAESSISYPIFSYSEKLLPLDTVNYDQSINDYDDF